LLIREHNLMQNVLMCVLTLLHAVVHVASFL